jgi:hypothetical protein
MRRYPLTVTFLIIPSAQQSTSYAFSPTSKHYINTPPDFITKTKDHSTSKMSSPSQTTPLTTTTFLPLTASASVSTPNSRSNSVSSTTSEVKLQQEPGVRTALPSLTTPSLPTTTQPSPIESWAAKRRWEVSIPEININSRSLG